MRNKKSEYVTGALEAAVKAIADVESLEYWVCNGREYVSIQYINGHEAPIRVDGDSLAATARDVFDYIICH